MDDDELSDYDFICKSWRILYKSADMHPFLRVFYLIFLCILLLMPISMSYVGVKNLMECPKQPKIPLYLFIGGFAWLIKVLQSIWDQWQKRKKEKFDQGDLIDVDGYENSAGDAGVRDKNSQFINFTLSSFILVWFCLGNYWVFSIWKPNYKQPPQEDSNNWCSQSVYELAVKHIIIVYSLFVLYLILNFVFFVISKIRHLRFNSNPDEQPVE